jgi:hypothetical protein
MVTCLIILVWRIYVVCSVFLLMYWNLFSVQFDVVSVVYSAGLTFFLFLYCIFYKEYGSCVSDLAEGLKHLVVNT